MKQDDEIKRKNLRTAWILVSVVLVFLIGFVGKIALMG